MELLESAFRDFTGMDEKAFALSVPFWRKKHYSKGEFFNAYGNVCKQLGFILDGVFRTYYVDDATAEEKNVFFSSKHQMVVSYKSFVEQVPCNYHTAALTDAHYDQRTDLYRWQVNSDSEDHILITISQCQVDQNKHQNSTQTSTA